MNSGGRVWKLLGGANLYLEMNKNIMPLQILFLTPLGQKKSMEKFSILFKT